MEELFIKVAAKTVEDAVLEASIKLGTTSDNIEYHIIERETKGFLGIGAKKALIEARRKKSEEDFINEVMRETEVKPAKGSRKKEADPEKKAAKKTEKKAVKETKKTEKKEEKAAEKSEKKAEKKSPEKAEKAEKKATEKAEKKAAEKAETVSENIQTQSEKAAETVTETVEKTAEAASENTVRVPADPEVVKARAEEFLSKMLNAMGVEASIQMEYEDGNLMIELEGNDMGILIGKRGQTLDSIQYLTSLVVNKGKASYVKVKIDTENYRERRKATLENLAKNMAFKVKKTRRPAYLEPMNPYERRIIHSALQNDPYVTTHSEGDEPTRKVVITLRKREKEEFAEE